MGDDRFYPATRQAKQTLFDRWHGTKIAKLNEQVVGICNGVALWMENCVLNVIEREVKIASDAELNPASHLVQLTQHPFVARAIVTKMFVGVGGRYYLPNAILRRHPTHLGCDLP